MLDIDEFYWNEETKSYQRFDETSPFNNSNKWEDKQTKKLKTILNNIREERMKQIIIIYPRMKND